MNSPRIKLRAENAFFSVFEDGCVPGKELPKPGEMRLSGRPVLTLTKLVRLEGIEGEVEVYLLDWQRCSLAQRGKIAAVASRLHGATANAFAHYMDRGGEMPIRLDQTTALLSDAPFLL